MEELATVSLPANINPCSLFLMWQALAGESRHVARATGVSVNVIESLRHDLRWDDLAGGKLGLQDKKLQKEIVRAQNYAQGMRLQKILDCTLALLEEDNCARLRASISATTPDGNVVLNTKPLVELAKATETVNNILYRSLGDKVAEEADSVADDSDRIRNLSLTVFNAVNGAAVHNGVMSSADVVRMHKNLNNV